MIIHQLKWKQISKKKTIQSRKEALYNISKTRNLKKNK